LVKATNAEGCAPGRPGPGIPAGSRLRRLAVHRDRETSVVVLEYAVHGRAVSTGRAYDNHFVSVITIKDRKITHWRDYLDPVAVFDAVGWPAP